MKGTVFNTQFLNIMMVQRTLIAIFTLILGIVLVPSVAHAQFAQFQSPQFSSAPLTRNAIEIPSPVGQIALGGSMFSFSGKRPTNIGVTDGKLATCPNTPNCVNSQTPATDKEHSITPLSYSKSPVEAMAALKSVIENMERTKIITSEGNYLYAEFTSALMGFVDDVEFYLDEEEGVIHVRSASRLGQSDLGVNRKRVEDIRAKLAAIA